jgi:hypothetical protein
MFLRKRTFFGKIFTWRIAHLISIQSLKLILILIQTIYNLKEIFSSLEHYILNAINIF